MPLWSRMFLNTHSHLLTPSPPRTIHTWDMKILHFWNLGGHLKPTHGLYPFQHQDESLRLIQECRLFYNSYISFSRRHLHVTFAPCAPDFQILIEIIHIVIRDTPILYIQVHEIGRGGLVLWAFTFTLHAVTSSHSQRCLIRPEEKSHLFLRSKHRKRTQYSSSSKLPAQLR